MYKNYSWLIQSVILMLIISKQNICISQTNSIENARVYYNQFQLENCRFLLQQIVSGNEHPSSDKAIALQTLAEQDWRLYKNFKEAKKKINIAIKLNSEFHRTFLLLGEIELDKGNFRNAKLAQEKSMQYAKSNLENFNSKLLFARIVYTEGIKQYAEKYKVDKYAIGIASDYLKDILTLQPGNQEASDLLIGISILNADGKNLFYAWKSYYFITDETKINSVLSPAFKTFFLLGQIWNNNKLNFSQLESLSKALAISKFYNYANFVVEFLMRDYKNKFKNNKEIQDIIHFNNFIEDIDKVNKLFYPKIATGLTDYENNYDTAIAKVCKKLWLYLNPGKNSKSFNIDTFLEAIKNRFGAEGYIGTTVGYYSLLLGLIIENDIKSIEQYGYKASFSSIILDRLISQDFTTWYGATNVGGWGTDSSMIQIRGAYLSAPFNRLLWVTDSTEKEKITERINSLKTIDFEKCKSDPYAEPSFISLQLSYNASQEIYASLKEKYKSKTELSLAFISECIRLNIESAVFGHEGRHAIDQFFFKSEFDSISNVERELRAKYSEVYFSTNPKLALTGSILGGNLDTTTFHGAANLIFRKNIYDWMNQHQEEIRNFDKNVPVLMQIDLLTNDQIRYICSSNDPLYIKRK